MLNPQEFIVLSNEKISDGLGGSANTEVEVTKVNGWIDLLQGSDDRRYQNAFVETSTHVFISNGYDSNFLEITDKMILKDESKTYDITYVDNPLGINHHMELYLRVK